MLVVLKAKKGWVWEVIMEAHGQNAPEYGHTISRWGEGHPLLEVTVGLLGNLVLVGLFAYYPARWFGLW
jgi:hypothetical protein